MLCLWLHRSGFRRRWRLRFVLIVFTMITLCRIQMTQAKPRKCRPVDKEAMSKLLGPALNSRYMSVDPPPQLDDPNGDEDLQGDQAKDNEFFVDNPNYEAPVQNYNLHLGHALMRRDVHRLRKRQSEDPTSKWRCESALEWEDLGDDYFPRFLRKVKCLCERCWYNHYKCRPRSFTVSLLRRRSDVKCSHSGKPTALEDEWEVIEKAVPFCCDCVAD